MIGDAIFYGVVQALQSASEVWCEPMWLFFVVRLCERQWLDENPVELEFTLKGDGSVYFVSFNESFVPPPGLSWLTDRLFRRCCDGVHRENRTQLRQQSGSLSNGRRTWLLDWTRPAEC